MTSILRAAKRTANQILVKFGHRIDQDTIIPRFGRLVEHLNRAGLQPNTVFDIGVAEGTPWLYDAYSHAKYYLVDPTPLSLPHMQAWAKTLDAEILNIALGDIDGKTRFNMRPDHDSSTMLEDYEDHTHVSIEVPINRFDSVINSFERPALMKIDAQGAEIMILKGMGARIKELDCIIVETALISTLKGGPEFAELVTVMRDNGFVLYDITGMLRRPLDRALTFIDAVFVPQDSFLRSDRRWHGAPEPTLVQEP